MKMFQWSGSVTLAAALVGGVAMVGCGDDDDNGGGTPDAMAATPDAPVGGGTVTINFGPIDDTANKVYAAGDLEWKGNMTYTAATNKIAVGAAGWDSKMWAPLYDDGPVPTGHEPPGQVANDNKWSVQVLMDKPVTGMVTGEYGLNDKSYRTRGGDGWLWPAGTANGTFVVTSTSTSVNAPGITLPAFGNIDLRITLDTTMLSPREASDAGPQTWDTSTVKIKSSAWSWGETTLTKDGSGKAILVLSDVVGAGKQWDNSGLLPSGRKVEWVFVLGADEYKVGGKAGKMGVTAEYKVGAGSFMTLAVNGGAGTEDTNTHVTTP
jgi:hypothetical protein